MENLTHHIVLDKDTINSSNLCDEFGQEDLKRIGLCCHEAYVRDVQSREPWTRRNSAAMDLAMQVQKSKSFPWQGCSNVAFPLVTIAAMQFHARAYPAIVNGRDMVKCRILGGDPDGIQAARAERISTHMSWQLLEQDECWEEDQDRALLNLPIVGTCFKKTYYDTSKGYNVSQLVLAQNLVFDYWAKSVETCPVKTHIIPMHRNRIHENVRRGIFADVLDEAWFKGDAQPSQTVYQVNADNRQGKNRPDSSKNTPFTILEQHCVLDLDGDGYAEPYIVTFEEDTQTVLRITTRFDRVEDIEKNDAGEIIKINGWEPFTKIPFIPSPDGGIMDVGFGTLLGPLNESVNSAINQLFDSGTMSNTAGGFLGRGAKIRGGAYEFSPFGWNRVDSTGDDLRKNIFPLPVREPSAVMFNLLELLIDYTNRIAGTVGELVGVTPGQNTPAETSRNAVEQGEKIYSAIYKRVWRALKWEFKKLYQLNAIHLPTRQPFGDAKAFVLREDYTQAGASVIPVADPTITSGAAKLARAVLVKAAAANTPGYDTAVTERHYLDALQVDDIDAVFPGPDKMPPPAPDVKVQIQQMKMQAEANQMQYDKWKFVISLQDQVRLTDAKIMELQASAYNLTQQGDTQASQTQINAFNAVLEAMNVQNRHVEAQVQHMLEELKNATPKGTSENGGRRAIPRLDVASSYEDTHAKTSGTAQGPDGSVGE